MPTFCTIFVGFVPIHIFPELPKLFAIPDIQWVCYPNVSHRSAGCGARIDITTRRNVEGLPWLIDRTVRERRAALQQEDNRKLGLRRPER